jgi:hypothetical protein
MHSVNSVHSVQKTGLQNTAALQNKMLQPVSLQTGGAARHRKIPVFSTPGFLILARGFVTFM